MRENIYFKFILLILLVSVLPPRVYSENTVKQLTNLNGLSNNSVNCIFQDSEGIMWFGTWGGLNSYNGRDFKTYRYNNNEHSISNNVIRQILESDPMYLWIATDYGINRWNRQTQQFDSYFLETDKPQPKQEKGYLINVTAKSDLICFVNNQGLFYFNRKTEKFVLIDDFPSKNNIRKFIIDQDNNIYFLYDNGSLIQYTIENKNNEIRLIHPVSVETNNPVSDIFWTNNFLILYFDSYIKVIDNKNLYPTSIDIDNKKTISEILYRNNNFLISYLEGGCDVYDFTSKKHTPLEGFPDNISVFSMYSGSQDILWIGTDGHGIWQMYEYEPPFNKVNTNHPVRAFCQKTENELLVGTKGDGIKIYDKKNKRISDFADQGNGLISNSVYIMKKNREGDIFVGTEGAGLNILSNDNLYTLTLPKKSPVFKSIYSIIFTNEDSCVWLGTSGFGLIKLDVFKENNLYKVKNVIQYSSSNKVSDKDNDIIYSIVEGENPNELWVATRRGGLFRFDIKEETFESLAEINKNLQLINDDVLCLSRDSNLLWVGTSHGLNTITLKDLDSSKIRTYTENQGITNNTIHGILTDNNESVWVSTNEGLSNISLTNAAVINYSIKDGLQNNEFSDGAYYKDPENTFYFGGVSGFNYFESGKISFRDFNPRIILSNLRIFNTPLDICNRINNNTLNLSHGEAYITFTFLVQDYINNENCEYSYRLVNFSDEWINNGQSPNIVLTNLSPGKYELQVKATNGDRVWSSDTYTLKIDVAYPWWLSIPAIIVYFILFIFILYIIYLVLKNRIRQKRKLLLEYIEKENQQKIHESKLNFFTNVAHEFFTPLTLIYGPAQHLLEKDDIDGYTKRYIQVIKNNADRMQKLISELMDFRKVESGHVPLYPEEIDIKLLIDYITDNYVEIAEETKVTFTIEMQNVSTIITDRNSIEKILFNLISNAFKYTPSSGYIKFLINQEQDTLKIRIKNSGKGLDKKQMSEIFNQFKIFDKPQMQNVRSTGIGLSLVKSLTELLGGTISVDSKLREYVEFNVSIPSINSEHKVDSITMDEEIISLNSNIQERKDISILIVEDEKNIRELLKDILTPYYNIAEASDGQEAIEMISRNTPDIIISDILMPNLDGIGLIDKLKSEAKTSHIPVINISAKISLDDRINAYEHGTDLYITKPFHPRHILATVQNLINKRSLLKDYFTSSLSAMTVKDGIQLHQEDESLLQKIVSFIEENIDDESLNPNSIADALGLSKATLYRKLQELAEKTPSEFVRSIRLNYASQLLITTKMTVQEVMFKSGFTNKSYFYREFAKQYNTSPGEYRQSKNE